MPYAISVITYAISAIVYAISAIAFAISAIAYARSVDTWDLRPAVDDLRGGMLMGNWNRMPRMHE
jgi:hypothetical protein